MALYFSPLLANGGDWLGHSNQSSSIIEEATGSYVATIFMDNYVGMVLSITHKESANYFEENKRGDEAKEQDHSLAFVYALRGGSDKMIRHDLGKCPFCYRIMPYGMSYEAVTPCPFCSKSGKLRIDWPKLPVKYLLMQMDDFDIRDPDKWSMLTVMMSIVLEVQVEALLTVVLEYLNTNLQVGNFVRSKSQGHVHMIETINKLSGFSIKAVLNQNGYIKFADYWSKLVKERNDFIHKALPVSSNCPKYILKMQDEMYDAFMLLNNSLLDHLNEKYGKAGD